MNSKIAIIAAAGLVAIGIGAWALSGGDTGTSRPESAAGAGSSEQATAANPTASGAAPAHGVDTPEADALRAKGYVVDDVPIGSDEAPVTIVEYASTTCPHCAAFHAETLPKLKRDYIETGKVRYVLREVYFNEPGLWSGLLARCGGPEQYHAFMDVLFAQMNDWTTGDSQQIADNLRRIGRLGGLGGERIEACLNDAELTNFMIARFRAEADADRVNSTPHFVINGQAMNGNQPYEAFREMLDAALENAEAEG